MFVLRLVLGVLILFPAVGVLGIILIDHYFDRKARALKELNDMQKIG